MLNKELTVRVYDPEMQRIHKYTEKINNKRNKQIHALYSKEKKVQASVATKLNSTTSAKYKKNYNAFTLIFLNLTTEP
jgi:hypothetical protein